ncbi:uncharacterized protein LOC134176114 isoform X2 [Corticium candelabrum]|uniref:uncharacterized protein LOC134176114 isoform X2 n=1 Tax=Corticium candelabrum TaxID=121492 RepID=UPI002E26A862|nr:uncharacterized protein LOC134176114 isoform X2 [Corticium candelabrum]
MGSIGSISFMTETLDKDMEQHKRKMANKNLIGIDMEAYPFMAYCRAAFPKSMPVVIKGISDYGNAEKYEYYQTYAASTAAAFLRNLLGSKQFCYLMSCKYGWSTCLETVDEVANANEDDRTSDGTMVVASERWSPVSSHTMGTINELRSEPTVTQSNLEKVKTLEAQVDQLQREKTAAVEKERKRADAQMRLITLALLWDRRQRVGDSQVDDSLPSWKQWYAGIPRSNSALYGRMGEIKGRLVVGHEDGKMHILTEKRDKWTKYDRKNGSIKHVLCHKDVCLLCVKKDTETHQVVIEQYQLNENKSRFLTVIPNELQLYNVSVALSENSLYVVGGRTKSGETVNTSRVCDLTSGHWSEMDDIPTKRYACSSAIINNTLFVGGGLTDCNNYSSVVECADVRDRKWRKIPSTTNRLSTLTAVGDTLVATGGLLHQSFDSDIVELYDERFTKWLPLPRMTHTRFLHSACSTENGELIVAGGWWNVKSIESIKC